MKYIVYDIETTGLNPWHGNQITCICARDSEGESLKECDRDQNETDLIKSFLAWVKQRKDHILVSKNGIAFDIPFILARLTMKFCDLKYYDALMLVRRCHVDLHTITKKWVSLDDMARMFKCGRKSGTGSNAIKLHEDGKYEELVSYCYQDVIITEQVYLRYERLSQL